MPDSHDEPFGTLEHALVELAVDSWRLSRLFARVLATLDAGEANRYASQLRYFEKHVNEHLAAVGLKTVSLEGQPFDPGIAASPVNLEDFAPDNVLLIDQMIEPIVMGPDGVKKQGTIVLRKANA